MTQLEVRQVVSEIGRPHPQRRVLRGLGLRGPGSSVVVADTPSFRGMIKKVLHLVRVESSGPPEAAAANRQKAAPKKEKKS